jgi:L-ribulose-5-phosphate 3-epimerase
VLRAFLERFDTGGLGVNLDPANLLLHDFDPWASARALRGQVVHCHATDARRAGAGRSAQEAPLGQGDVGWPQYLGVLEEIGYRGWLTVEREGVGNHIAEVAAGVDFLRRFVGAP